MAKILNKAVSPEQKKQRYSEIMDVTDELFQNHTYHEITLTIIAEKLGWSRGNLYKYVSTKEDIFLSLYLVKQKHFIDCFEKQLNSGETITEEMFADSMSISFEQNIDYLKYHGIMATIIETNVSIEKLAMFKKQSYADRQTIFRYLAQITNSSQDDQIIQLFLTILSHGCGLYALTEYSDTYIKSMELAGLQIQKVNFREEYKKFILMCLKYYPL